MPDYNIIIETHGIQHYEGNSNWRASLEEQQCNDIVKKELAIKNNIDKYIVVDCRNSDSEWIKDNILNSELNEIFDLSNINWNKAESFALSNLVKEVCDYWNSKEEWETPSTIAKNNIWGIKSDCTIRKYLKIGSSLKWCCYNAEEEHIKYYKKKSKRVEVFQNDSSLGVFESLREIERVSVDSFGVRLYRSEIKNVCLGNRDIYKGFTFKYVEDIE